MGVAGTSSVEDALPVIQPCQSMIECTTDKSCSSISAETINTSHPPRTWTESMRTVTGLSGIGGGCEFQRLRRDHDRVQIRSAYVCRDPLTCGINVAMLISFGHPGTSVPSHMPATMYSTCLPAYLPAYLLACLSACLSYDQPLGLSVKMGRWP